MKEMHRAGAVAKQGKYNPAGRGIQSPERYRDALTCPETRVPIPAPTRFLQENRPRMVKMPGESMWAISQEKSVSPTSPYIGSSIREGIRKMCGLDESKQETYRELIDEITAAVWNGPGTYGIESLVPDVCSVDVTCFDIDGLKCELDDMFPDGLCRGDVDIYKY